MPQSVKFSTQTSFGNGGPNIPKLEMEKEVGSNVAIMEEVPNDKDWHEYEVLGGVRENIEFMMLGAKQYKDQHCPRQNEPGLLFKFDKDDDFVLQLDRPLMYSGHTASCLPPRIDSIYVQNRMADKTEIYLLLGRKRKKTKDEENENGQAQTNAAAAAN